MEISAVTLSLCDSAGFLRSKIGDGRKSEGGFSVSRRWLPFLYRIFAQGGGGSQGVCALLLGFFFSPTIACVLVSVSFETTMSFGWAQEAGRSADAPDVLPSPPHAPLRSDAAILANGLSESADDIKWPRAPELREFAQMADVIISAGHYNFGELADAFTAERAQLYKILADGGAGRARLLRKMLNARSPPAEVEAGRSLPFKEVDLLSALGELLRPRQEAVNLSSGALHEGSKAAPP